MQKYIYYRLHIHLKYLLIHDLLKNIFQQYMTWPYSRKKSSMLGIFGNFGAFFRDFGPKNGSKSILGQTKKNKSKNFPNSESPKKMARGTWLGEPGAWNDCGTPTPTPPCFGAFLRMKCFTKQYIKTVCVFPCSEIPQTFFFYNIF